MPFSQNCGGCGFIWKRSAPMVTNIGIQTFSSYYQGTEKNLSKIFLCGNNIWSHLSKKNFLQRGALVTHKQQF